ncbi:MAG: 6-hydroxymethylpterin diphosphokinase MptE-like protein [Halobacteriales archaeon]
MNYDAWAPAYEAILEDFGYDRAADEAARDRLAELATGFEEERLADIFEGATVAVAGAAPSLADDCDVAAAADVVVAASTAADVLLEYGISVDVQVTDLDGTPATSVELAAEGVVVAVHAHGDNRAALEDWVPELAPEALLPTTQAAPAHPVVNYGGFTDGDRSAFLADHFGAAELRFPGWAFEDPTVDGSKSRKLRWAERLLVWLEDRRGERFAVLDGRRASIDRQWA